MGQATSTGLFGSSELLETLRWVDARAALKHTGIPFVDGSRALYHWTLPVPAGPLHVSISLVNIFGQDYVCEILSRAADGGSHLIVYPHPASEGPVAEVPGVAGFRLVQDWRGVRGLAVLSTSTPLSEWARDHVDISVRKLTFDPATAAHNSV